MKSNRRICNGSKNCRRVHVWCGLLRVRDRRRHAGKLLLPRLPALNRQRLLPGATRAEGRFQTDQVTVEAIRGDGRQRQQGQPRLLRRLRLTYHERSVSDAVHGDQGWQPGRPESVSAHREHLRRQRAEVGAALCGRADFRAQSRLTRRGSRKQRDRCFNGPQMAAGRLAPVTAAVATAETVSPSVPATAMPSTVSAAISTANEMWVGGDSTDPEYRRREKYAV